MTEDLGKWPNSEMALEEWCMIKAGFSTLIARWRLCETDKSVGERMALDVIALAQQASGKRVRYDKGISAFKFDIFVPKIIRVAYWQKYSYIRG